MTITNKQVCETCGAPSARIYAYWPVTLCQTCAAERVANEKAAEAAQEAPAVVTAGEPSEAVAAPESTTEATAPEQPVDTRSTATIGRARRRANKSARRQAMREAAKQWTSEHNDQLPLQLGLCGRLVRQGDVFAARNLATAAMVGWVNARFTRLKGTPSARPVDAMLAVLRASGAILTASNSASWSTHGGCYRPRLIRPTLTAALLWSAPQRLN